MSTHLTDEQFGALLIGEEVDAPTAAHLAHCALCQRELATVNAATATFNELGGNWAQTEARRSVRVPSRLALRLGARPSLALGLAAAAACLIGIGISTPLGHLHRLQDVSSVAGAPARVDVAQDNRLLQSIDADLRSGSDLITIPVSELRSAGQSGKGKPVSVVLN